MHTALMVCSGGPEEVERLQDGQSHAGADGCVTMFLNGPAACYASLASEDFPLTELAKVFTLSEGVLLA